MRSRLGGTAPNSPRIPHEQGDEMANVSHKALSVGHCHRRAGSVNFTTQPAACSPSSEK